MKKKQLLILSIILLITIGVQQATMFYVTQKATAYATGIVKLEILGADTNAPLTIKEIIDRDCDGVEDSVTLTCIDLETGCANITFIDNNEINTIPCFGQSTCNITVNLTSGFHKVEFFSTDISRNKETIVKQTHIGDACPDVIGLKTPKEYVLKINEFQSNSPLALAGRVFVGNTEVFPDINGKYRIPLINQSGIIIDKTNLSALPKGIWIVDRKGQKRQGKYSTYFGNSDRIISGIRGDGTGTETYVYYNTTAQVDGPFRLSNYKWNKFERQGDDIVVPGKIGQDEFEVVYEIGTSCPAIECGDGLIENGEGCDDGNTNNGDGCNSICEIEEEDDELNCDDDDCELDDDGLSAGDDDDDDDNGGFKVTICHIPPGNPGNTHTITASPSAVPAHLAHGDTLGACSQESDIVANGNVTAQGSVRPASDYYELEFGDFRGCPFIDKTFSWIRIIDKNETGICGTQTTCKLPLENVSIKIYDRENPNFITAHGTGMPPSNQLDNIFATDIGLIGKCTTNKDGNCVAQEEKPGKFLVIGKLTDLENNMTIYQGRLKKFPNNVIENYEDKEQISIKDRIRGKHLNFIKIIKRNGKVKYKGSYTEIGIGVVTASNEISTANYGETHQFIFTAENNITLNVCEQTPKGYEITSMNNNEKELTGCWQTVEPENEVITVFEQIPDEPSENKAAREKADSNITKCITEWDCSEWSDCVEKQYRTCHIKKPCGQEGRPPEERECKDTLIKPPNCHDFIQNNEETGIDCGGDCEPCGFQTPLNIIKAAKINLTANTIIFLMLITTFIFALLRRPFSGK